MPAFVSAALALACLNSLIGQPVDTAPPKDLGPAPSPTAPVQAIPLPEKSPLTFDSLIHDWGQISDDKPVTHEFKLHNRSNKTVTILDVKASCGCTGATADKTIAPGADGKITVTFNPAGRNGREVKTVNVTLDDPECPLLQLTTVADVLRRIIIEPGAVGFGEVAFGNGGSQEVTIAGRADGFDVKDAKSADPLFTVEMLGKDVVETLGAKLPRTKFRVTLDPKAPIGPHNSAITATTTDPNMPTLNVPIYALVVGNVRVVPERAAIRMDGSLSPFVSDITVSSPTGKPFNVKSIDVEAPEAMHAAVDFVPIDPKSKAVYRLRIVGTTPSSIADVKGSVTLYTDDPDQPRIAIPLVAFYVGKPQMPMPAPQPVPAVAPPTGH